MAGSKLLDTNIVIAIFNARETMEAHLRAGHTLFVPTVVLGELYHGAERSTKRVQSLSRIDDFSAEVTILDCNAEVAREYGRVKAALHKKGRPIPENDIWIAAVALHHELTLVTRDAHFAEVAGLPTETW